MGYRENSYLKQTNKTPAAKAAKTFHSNANAPKALPFSTFPKGADLCALVPRRNAGPRRSLGRPSSAVGACQAGAGCGGPGKGKGQRSTVTPPEVVGTAVSELKCALDPVLTEVSVPHATTEGGMVRVKGRIVKSRVHSQSR